jgi:cytochrome c553
MKFAAGFPVICAVLLAAAIGAGCTNIERSRNLADATVPGKVLALQVCSNCHGADGNSVSPNFPNLAAQTEPYVVEQLTSFRKHSRFDPAGFEYMWGLSRHLTDEQIRDIAAYFARQKVRSPSYLSGRPDLRGVGKAVFSGGVPESNIPPCAACHGPEGMGTNQFPRIAGQHADYSVKQMIVFQRTDERPEGAVMKVIVHDLSRDNIEAVASYLESLPAR